MRSFDKGFRIAAGTKVPIPEEERFPVFSKSTDGSIAYKQYSDGVIRAEASYIGPGMARNARIIPNGSGYQVDFGNAYTGRYDDGSFSAKTLTSARRVAWHWIKKGEKRVRR